METDTAISDDTFGRRWVRELDVAPGYWKKQLPGRYRRLAERGDLKGMQALLEDHPDWINRRGSHGRTFLFEAVRKGRHELVVWLLELGADMSLTGCYNSESLVQLSPLAAARFYGRTEMEQLLSARGARDDIFRAAFCGRVDFVQYSLGEDSTLINAEDPEDEIYYTPLLSFAVAGREGELAASLIEQGALIAPYSFQLLFIAAHMNDISMVQLLLDAGADPRVADAQLWMATDDMEILEILVASGLSANQSPYHGLHPLMYACRGDKRKNLAKVSRLVELGADLDAQSSDGRTAMHYAARVDNLEVVELLLAAGANAQIPNDEGQPAVDVARIYGHDRTMNLLRNKAKSH